MQILLWILAALLGYLLGSINAAIIITKIFLHSDVRAQGSHNAGTANVARVFGPWIGLATLVLDILKTIAALALGNLLLGAPGIAIACLGCLAGHCWPMFFQFRGGKGVAVTAGIALYLDWRVFLVLLVVYVLAFLLLRTASIASLSGVTLLPAAMALFGGFTIWHYIAACAGVAVVWVMHRGNLSRLFHGEENKFNFQQKSK